MERDVTMGCNAHMKDWKCKDPAVFHLKYKQRRAISAVSDALRDSRNQAREVMSNSILQVPLVLAMLQVLESIELLVEKSLKANNSALINLGVSRFFFVVER